MAPVRFRFITSSTSLLTVILTFTCAGAPAGKKCIDFLLPEAGAIIQTPSCTISVDACPDAKSIEFSALYYKRDAESRERVLLGTITRPPYKLVWDISELPNQLFRGLTLTAKVRMADGQERETRQEGIFLAHRDFSVPKASVPAASKSDAADRSTTIELTGPDSEKKATASIWWNRHAIHFRVQADDPLFYASMPNEHLAEMGCEILIDPSTHPAAYPTDSVIAVCVPLYGEPYRRHYQPRFVADGSYQLSAITEEYASHVSLAKANFKGWRASCKIDREIFGGRIPDRVRCNVVVKLLNEDHEIRHYSWVEGNLFSIYTPLRWGTLRLRNRPMLQNPLIVWSLSFILGLVLSVGTWWLIANRRSKNYLVRKFELSEEQKRNFDKIKSHVDVKLTDRDLTLDTVASELSLAPKEINRLLRKHLGEPFHTVLMRSRTEIAKERLRSSNSSEAAIADMCGFRSVNEMEKYFRRFCHTNPYKYRVEQQVT